MTLYVVQLKFRGYCSVMMTRIIVFDVLNDTYQFQMGRNAERERGDNRLFMTLVSKVLL